MSSVLACSYSTLWDCPAWIQSKYPRCMLVQYHFTYAQSAVVCLQALKTLE
jgi:hypothetical protein